MQDTNSQIRLSFQDTAPSTERPHIGIGDIGRIGVVSPHSENKWTLTKDTEHPIR